jgi:hypothetical protein
MCVFKKNIFLYKMDTPKQWIALTQHPNFEITTPSSGDFIFRKKLTTGASYHYINQNFNKKSGYFYVRLEKHIPVHRAIAEQFIDNTENSPYATHINGDKTDNRVENIAWVVKRNRKERARQNVFIGELPDGYEAFTEYTVKPERVNSSGETIPADVRRFDNLFIKWDEGLPCFLIHNAQTHQCQTVKHDKQNPNCVKIYDQNHKLTSITFSKIQRELLEEAPQE